MEIRNAVLLQGVSVCRERQGKLSKDLRTIERGSQYRVVGELSLADVFQHPTLAIALEKFGDVDLVLVECRDVIRGQIGLFDDFLDFGIKLAFIDDIMEEIYVIDEQSLSDPHVSEFIDINNDEIESLAAVGKYKLKQALQGYQGSQPQQDSSREKHEQMYQAMEEIVRSGEAVMLGSISLALQKRGFDTMSKDGKPTPLHESQLRRIVNALGKAKEFSELRRSNPAKRKLTPRRKE